MKSFGYNQSSPKAGIVSCPYATLGIRMPSENPMTTAPASHWAVFGEAIGSSDHKGRRQLFDGKARMRSGRRGNSKDCESAGFNGYVATGHRPTHGMQPWRHCSHQPSLPGSGVRWPSNPLGCGFSVSVRRRQYLRCWRADRAAFAV